MSLIWPTHPHQFPDGFMRLGRALHWIGMLLALIMVAAAIYASTDGASDSGAALAIFGSVALFFYFAGRGLRYVIAGE